MAQQSNIFLLSILITLASLYTTADGLLSMITNNAGTSAGSVRFEKEIGEDYSMETLASATEFVWKVFHQTETGAGRKSGDTVALFIDNMDRVSYTSGHKIHVSAKYIAQYSGDVKKEITGLLHHEVTHVWQWNGDGKAPKVLIEGIADFVRLRAGYAQSQWVQPGEGKRWDQGYDVTARFLDYCTSLKDGFVAELNNKMKSGYSVSYFSDILGKNVDQLWVDYKAKYGKNDL